MQALNARFLTYFKGLNTFPDGNKLGRGKPYVVYREIIGLA